MGPATAPAARKTLRRAPLRLMSENIVMEIVGSDGVGKTSCSEGVEDVDEMSDMKIEDGKTFFICRVQSPT
jgi:hypothetical protein